MWAFIIPFVAFMAIGMLYPKFDQVFRDSVDPTVVVADRYSEDAILGQEDLDLFQAGSIEDFSGIVPGLHVVSSDAAGYGNNYTMRGSGNVLFFGPPAVTASA